ncbi:CD3324 family protein [Terrisporobacter vanillatitrophus]|uniref:CD3324 family protein n=1 Tax=Terrisporobacter vanillatitrophus TaxID=3058402 RepID=UPI0033691CB9
MKYEKAQDILPSNIIEILQEYIEGGYIYIPKKNKKSWGENTNTKNELKKRNEEILIKYSSGKSVKDLANEYYLTESSIRRIIRSLKK